MNHRIDGKVLEYLVQRCLVTHVGLHEQQVPEADLFDAAQRFLAPAFEVIDDHHGIPGFQQLHTGV